MKKIKEFISSQLLGIVGAIVGAVGGYVYWLKVGCADGTCAITSSPFNSTIYGLIMGYLIFSMFKSKKVKKDENKC